MPGLFTTIGPVTLPTFTFALVFAILASAGVALYRARENRGELADAYLAALVGGVIGARAGHVLLNWDYFAYNQNEIWRISSGGLDWHGAVIGGLVSLYLAARWHRLSWRDLLDSLVLILPVIALAGWWGCMAANCGYGIEVDTLANYPALIVAEVPDVYGIPAPRYNTPFFGMIFSLLMLALVWLLRWQGWLIHRRFWLMLIIFSLGMFALGFWRGDHAVSIAGLRADQWLDAALVIAGAWRLWMTGHGT
jgi:phosphatidylglycerol:prolipoprotein diacylglycerol transferase